MVWPRSRKWADFNDRYQAELIGASALDELLAVARQHRRVTLVFAARDTERDNAVVLQTVCERRLKDE